jgi:probable O-glycosylation ligase (exosortase A-associated)
MKQLLLMIILTVGGALGALFNGPFWGLTIYYLFAVLRPQYLWKWVLPTNVQWSFYVAIPTLIATVLHGLGFYYDPDEPTSKKRFGIGHAALLGFAIWLLLSYLFARNQARSTEVVIEYSKIFTMMAVSAFIVRRLWQIWVLFFVALFSLVYIAYEVNYLYLVNNYLGIYLNGYGGLDNNGAGLMLAMAVPFCVFIFDSHGHLSRWFFAAMVPVLLHAVLMTYSRGAMVALLVCAPLIFLRSRRKGLMTLGFVALAFAVPILAGPEIRERFFSVERYEEDQSAQSRFSSWSAGLAIANDYPIFGIGPRNSPLVVRQYGGDRSGRVIHSQYIQIAADMGWVGLAWYLAILASAFLSLRRVRRTTRKDLSADGRRVHGLACALECSMAVFCVGAFFLSLEVFELPYLLMMLSMQLPRALEAAPVAQMSQPAEPITTRSLSPLRGSHLPPLRPTGTMLR